MKLFLWLKFLLLAAVLSSGLGAYFLFALDEIRHHLSGDFRQARSLARLLADASRTSLYLRDRENEIRLLQSTSHLPVPIRITLYDIRRQAWLTWPRNSPPVPLREYTVPPSFWNPPEWKDILITAPITAPVQEGEAGWFEGPRQTIGYLSLRWELAPVRQRLGEQLLTTLGASLILALVTWIFAVQHIKRHLIRPLHTLRGHLKSTREGKSRVVRKLSSIRELRSLEEGFNELIQWLETYRTHLENLAFSDELTGLANRAFLQQQVDHWIGLSRRQGFSLGVIFLDLDRFKVVNDSLGHRAGDLLLCEIAVILKGATRKSDLICRMGGDEFVILLTTLSENPRQAHLQALAVVNKIREDLRRAITIGEHEITATASMGIALFPHDAEDFDTLLRYADSAMYQAKHNGRNNFCFHHQATDSPTPRRLSLEAALRRAIDGAGLPFHLQPQVRHPEGCIVGAEALLRFHWEGRWIPTAEFIPLLEETGLIFPATEQLVITLLDHKRRWREAGICGHFQRLAVNLSPVQLWRPDLAEHLLTTIQRLEGDRQPVQLEFELTESALLQPTPQILETFERFKAHDIRLAIDDFGTGYSNLSHLHHLPIDLLKIDQCFVQEMAQGERHRALVAAIIAISRSLELEVIAEGVETREQVEQLHRLGCHIFQGFHFSRPLPPEAFEELLRRQPREYFEDTGA